MTKPDPKRIDREALHAYFWKNADSTGRLRINQSDLARDLAIDRTTVARIFREMEVGGRITKISEGYRRQSLYKITDPDTYKWSSLNRKT